MLDGSERFSLLLLEENEYLFRDQTAQYHLGSARIPAQLMFCSFSLYVTPKNVSEPITRIPLRHTTAIVKVEGDGRELLEVHTTERTDMKHGGRSVPYVTRKGNFTFRLSLCYTSLDRVLPTLHMLHEICVQDMPDGMYTERAQRRMQEMIEAHEAGEVFNPGWFEDENERAEFMETVSRITPLCCAPGRAVVSSERVYFQPFNVVSSVPILIYRLSNITAVLKRKYMLEDIGLELFFLESHSSSLYLTFANAAVRNHFRDKLLTQPGVNVRRMHSRAKWTADWVAGRVSNFDYLLVLNREAGRSFNDLTQYPVFPWVIADYHSRILDLSKKSTFRDLSKPIGALNPDRLAGFRERYEELKASYEDATAEDPMSHAALLERPFMYGCHYSTPGYVVYYLLRTHPNLMLRLQNGRYDSPDRLFNSIPATWSSLMTLHTDVKELIPEFYMTSAFLVNHAALNLGRLENGAVVDDVELPPWAHNADDFTRQLAAALESPHVSKHLNKWIDLVFGFKQKGAEAEAADNVFHYLTLDDIATTTLRKEQDPVVRDALRIQMMEFGRCPQQLFTSRHPKRSRRPRLLSCMRPKPPPTPHHMLHQHAMAPPRRSRRDASAISRAVAKLAGARKAAVQADTLAWIENAAQHSEPHALLLKHAGELERLVTSTTDANAPDGQLEVAVRAMAALSVAPGNRRYILEAGGLDIVLDGVGGDDVRVAGFAARLLVSLCKEEDERMQNFGHSGARALLTCAASNAQSTELRSDCAVCVAHLSRHKANRDTFSRHGVVRVMLAAMDKSQPQVLREEATNALAALMVDEASQTELKALHGLATVLSLCREPSLRLQIPATRCLAALSTHEDSKMRIARRGGLRALCAAACAMDPDLQLPAAEAITHLLADPALMELVVAAEGLESIFVMAQSPNAAVQQAAARSLWTLATNPGNRSRLLAASGLQPILALANIGERNPAASCLAYDTLRALASEDASVAAELERIDFDLTVEPTTSMRAKQASASTDEAPSHSQSLTRGSSDLPKMWGLLRRPRGMPSDSQARPSSRRSTLDGYVGITPRKSRLAVAGESSDGAGPPQRAAREGDSGEGPSTSGSRSSGGAGPSGQSGSKALLPRRKSLPIPQAALGGAMGTSPGAGRGMGASPSAARDTGTSGSTAGSGSMRISSSRNSADTEDDSGGGEGHPELHRRRQSEPNTLPMRLF